MYAVLQAVMRDLIGMNVRRRAGLVQHAKHQCPLLRSLLGGKADMTYCGVNVR
jgi:hypothetical protein